MKTLKFISSGMLVVALLIRKGKSKRKGESDGDKKEEEKTDKLGILLYFVSILGIKSISCQY